MYELAPDQHVLFEHGSLREVVDHETSPCGCPEPKGMSVADALVAPPSAEHRTQIRCARARAAARAASFPCRRQRRLGAAGGRSAADSDAQPASSGHRRARLQRSRQRHPGSRRAAAAGPAEQLAPTAARSGSGVRPSRRSSPPSSQAASARSRTCVLRRRRARPEVRTLAARRRCRRRPKTWCTLSAASSTSCSCTTNR